MNTLHLFVVISLVAIVIAAGSIYYTYSIVESLTRDMQILNRDIDLLKDVLRLGDEDLAALLGDLETREAVIRAAIEEGSVTLYTSIAQEPAEELCRRFEEKYPFINAELYRAKSTTVVERFVAEMEAGRASCDVQTVTGMAEYLDWIENDWVEKYISPEYANYPQWAKDMFPSDYGAVTCRLLWDPIHYNKLALEARGLTPPTSWWDLTKPEYKGLMTFSNPETSIGTTVCFKANLANPDLGPAWYDALAANGPVTIYASAAVHAEALVSGDAVIGMEYGDRCISMWADQGFDDLGTVLDAAAPFNPTWLMIPSNAPHPNAAILLLDFILSEEGQSIMCYDAYLYSSRLGWTPKSPLLPISDTFQLWTLTKDLMLNQTFDTEFWAYYDNLLG